MKNQILNLTMSLLVHINQKDTIKMKVREFLSKMLTKMITCRQTFLHLTPKKVRPKEDHKKQMTITQGTMKKHQEEMSFMKMPRNKRRKKKASNKRQMKINVK